MSRLARELARLRRSSFGGIAVIFAATLPFLLTIAGLATDYATLIKFRLDLQQAADAAALAGAREIPLAVSKASRVASAVRSYAAYELTGNAAASDAELGARQITLDIQVIDNFSAVRVMMRQAWQPFFMHFLDASATPVTVTAQARFVGRNNICVLGLGNDKKTVFLDKAAKLTGNNCGVFSNAAASDGLFIDTGAYLRAKIICSTGGAPFGRADVSPAPVTDCPKVDDPLAQRAAPSVSGCDHDGLVVGAGSKTLGPGVYCGGLTISGKANVTLDPGIYVIKDGGLVVAGQATAQGSGVGFYITDAAAAPIHFTPKTHISLAAAKDGPMAGLLVFEDRNLPVKLKHKISSDDARTLLGTIYLPVGGLVVDASQPVADQSAHTAIVAKSLELNFGPNLILNSDYDMTDVPVPAGIAGSSQVVLSN